MNNVENAPAIIQWLNNLGVFNYLRENFSVTQALAIILVVSIIILILAIIVIIFMCKICYKINKKNNLVINLTFKDFLASWSLIFGIFDLILIISSFNVRDILLYFFLFVCGICGVIFYKHKYEIIKENGYKGVGLVLRLISTFIFGLISLPVLIIYMPVIALKGTKEVIENMPDVDVEYGSAYDEAGNKATYVSYNTKNTKVTTYTDEDGNKYYSNTIKKQEK